MHRLILLIATLCLLWGNPVSAQISGGGGGGGAGDASAANQVTEHGYIGATTDAAATAGSTGSLSAKLRLLTSDLDAIKTSIQLLDDAIHASDAALSKVLAAGCQFDDTTPGTTTEDSVRAVRCSTRREIYEVIRDAAGNERGANVNASNELQVSLSSVPSHPVTNAGTFATQAAQSGTWTVQPGNTANTTPWLATISQGGNAAAVNASGQLSITCANCSGSGASAVDDAAFTVATDSGAPAMGLFDDVAPDSVNEGDAGVLRMSANRALYVNIRDNAGNERGLNIDASGNLSANQAGTWNITNVSGTVSLPTGAATAAKQPALGTAGTASSDVITVQGIASMTALKVDGSAVTQPVSMATNTPVGNVAHDAADSGAPLKVGAKAIAHGTNPTAVAAADRTDLYANRAGILFTIGGHPNSKTIEAQIEDADGAQTNAALITVSAGTKIAVTRLSMTCDAGNTGPINAVVGFGTASVPARAHTGAVGILHGFDGMPAGGGITIGDGSGILGIGADDEDVRLTMEDPAGGGCSVSLTYFTIES